ncbi:MAG: hypothetical protein Q8L88_02375 [Bacteroidota bacterium]|nr:hypothetical protein [Bacteroidota bacterium]
MNNYQLTITNEEWSAAENHILKVMIDLMNKGSYGIAQYCEKVLPIRQRFNNGERTGELYKLMMKAK